MTPDPVLLPHAEVGQPAAEPPADRRAARRGRPAGRARSGSQASSARRCATRTATSSGRPCGRAPPRRSPAASPAAASGVQRRRGAPSDRRGPPRPAGPAPCAGSVREPAIAPLENRTSVAPCSRTVLVHRRLGARAGCPAAVAGCTGRNDVVPSAWHDQRRRVPGGGVGRAGRCRRRARRRRPRRPSTSSICAAKRVERREDRRAATGRAACWSASRPRSRLIAPAAGTPWPTASPTTRASRPAPSGTASYQSPPADRHRAWPGGSCRTARGRAAAAGTAAAARAGPARRRRPCWPRAAAISPCRRRSRASAGRPGRSATCIGRTTRGGDRGPSAPSRSAHASRRPPVRSTASTTSATRPAVDHREVRRRPVPSARARAFAQTGSPRGRRGSRSPPGRTPARDEQDGAPASPRGPGTRARLSAAGRSSAVSQPQGRGARQPRRRPRTLGARGTFAGRGRRGTTALPRPGRASSRARDLGPRRWHGQDGPPRTRRRARRTKERTTDGRLEGCPHAGRTPRRTAGAPGAHHRRPSCPPSGRWPATWRCAWTTTSTRSRTCASPSTRRARPSRSIAAGDAPLTVVFETTRAGLHIEAWVPTAEGTDVPARRLRLGGAADPRRRRRRPARDAGRGARRRRHRPRRWLSSRWTSSCPVSARRASGGLGQNVSVAR